MAAAMKSSATFASSPPKTVLPRPEIDEVISRLMSAFGTKQTSESTQLMSAFGGKADIVGEGPTHIDVLVEGGVKTTL